MKSSPLALDYIERAAKRLHAIQTLIDLEDWPDAVRESQETVELALKALLRLHRIEPPRVHDVSSLLEQQGMAFTAPFRAKLPEIIEISRALRRDRDLAFYGSEDLTPSQFYRRSDAEQALQGARLVVGMVKAEMAGGGSEDP